ncbi:MAG TPA: hypothetical protein VH592_01700 [Gemmataceae bacterium]
MRSVFVRSSSSWLQRENRPSRRRSIRRVRPQLEKLEDRLALSAVWTPQGPGPLLNGQPSGLEQQGNPDVGAVNALVPDPSNVNILYAATTSGGIWETTDATDTAPTWVPLLGNQPNLSIGDLAMSPLDPNTLYAGTGHFSNGNIGNYGMTNGPVGDGVLKSTDGGQTWSSLLGQATLQGQNIRSILPTSLTTSSGQVVLVGTFVYSTEPPPANQPQQGGVYRSSDGGQTWIRLSGSGTSGLPDGDVKSLVEDPSNANIIYAGVIGQGIYQSVNGGQTWQAVNGNIPTLLQSAAYGLSGTENLQLAVNSNNGTTTLFLLTGGSGPSTPGEKPPGVSYLFYSTNGGTSWTEMDPVPEINEDDQEGNNLALTADPNNPTEVWITGSDAPAGDNRSIVYSGNYMAQPGNQWQLAVVSGASGIPPGATDNTPTVTHSDGRYLGFDAAGNLLLTNDGGIYKLVNPEGAANQRYWVSLIGTLQDTELYSVAYDSIDHIIVGGAQDNSMGIQPQPGAAAWNTEQVFNDDVPNVAVDNSGPTAIVYGIGSQFVNSDDPTNPIGGFVRGPISASGTPLNQVDLASSLTPTQLGSGLSAADMDASEGSYIPFALDAAQPNWLVIGFNDLYLSTDQGDTITQVTPMSVSGQFTATAFGGTPGGSTNPNVAVAGTSMGQIFVSVNANAGGNAGGTFNLAETIPNSVVRSIAFDAGNWQTLYIVTTAASAPYVGQVWQMTLANNGQVFSLTEITGNLDTQVSQLETVVAVNPAPGVTTLVVGGTGTGSGSAFRTVGPINGSATQWQLLGSGLPNVNVHDLVYNAADNVLVAATFGRGAWTLANASQALLPPVPPTPPSPPSPLSPPTSPATFPTLVQQQLQLNVALLPTLSDAQSQASLAQLFGAAFTLAQQQSPSQAQQLVQQEATLFLDLALSNMAAAIADANVLADIPLYNTTLGFTLGLIEGELILSTIVTNS